MKKVFIIDPYYADSHRYWAKSMQRNLPAEVIVLSKPPVHWKWRMEASAIDFAKEVIKKDIVPEVFLVSDFLNLSLFKSLLPQQFLKARFVIYMHENQLTYPKSSIDSDTLHQRDNHYGFINYTSCLVADAVAFNSHYHLRSFFEGLDKLSKRLPDRLQINEIERKSVVLPLTMEYDGFEQKQTKVKSKTIIWNHRWEHDKRPEVFLDGMVQLKRQGYDFRLVLLGKMKVDHAFQEYFEKLADRIDHLGYAEDRTTYLELLRNADIIASTSIHDFFGISVLEGLVAGCQPVLPNDLAYPELIPKSLWSLSLYGKDGFVRSMAQALTPSNNWNAEHRSLLKEHIIDKFSWANLEKDYCAWLEL